LKLDLIYDFYNFLQKDNLSFFYHGSFSDNITDKAIDLSDKNIENISKLTKMKKKVSFLMAECIQNIVRHGEGENTKTITGGRSEMFFTRNIDDTYFISSANLIDKEKEKFLKEKLKQVNELDGDGLKKLYMDILANEGMSEKGGAGLGLVEMARKSGEKLNYDFHSVDDKYTFFYLQIKLSRKDEENETIPDGLEIPVDNMRSIHNSMDENGVLILYKGDFSESSILPMLLVVEESTKNSENKTKKKRLFSLMVEMLQNISLHSVRQNGVGRGILLLGKENDNFVLGTGNYIKNSDVEMMKEKLELVSHLNREELRSLYRETLDQFGNRIISEPSLGLIAIAKDCESIPSFAFIPVDDKYSFFSISVSV
jgi:hypothetical protein